MSANQLPAAQRTPPRSSSAFFRNVFLLPSHLVSQTVVWLATASFGVQEKPWSCAAPGRLADEGTDAGWLTIQRKRNARGGSSMPAKVDVAVKWGRLINLLGERRNKQASPATIKHQAWALLWINAMTSSGKKGGKKPSQTSASALVITKRLLLLLQQEKADWFFTSYTKNAGKSLQW